MTSFTRVNPHPPRHSLVYKIMERLILEKSNVYKSYGNSKNNNNILRLSRLKLLQEDQHNAVEVSKLTDYSRMTNKWNYMEKIKSYWALLKRLVNNKKMPLIPPLFQGNKYVTDFKKKSWINYFFAKKLRNNVLWWEILVNHFFSTLITQPENIYVLLASPIMILRKGYTKLGSK